MVVWGVKTFYLDTGALSAMLEFRAMLECNLGKPLKGELTCHKTAQELQ